MIEKALRFGETNELVGVVTMPRGAAAPRTAVLVLNAGLIHHVGPFRMHVELARALAGEGSLVCRIDQSGLGDSAPRPGAWTYEARAVRDARDAMDAVKARFGAEQFVLVGLCAGAMSVHRAAVADPRVVGVCLLDGYAYKTQKASLYAKLHMTADIGFWKRAGERAITVLQRGFGGEASGARDRPSQPASARQSHPDLQLSQVAEAAESPAPESDPGQGASEVFAQDWPPRETIARELDTIVSRGVRALFVYTGGWSDYVHKDQFDEMFPRLTHRHRVQVEFFPDADHTYLVVEHRDKMIRRVADFAKTF